MAVIMNWIIVETTFARLRMWLFLSLFFYEIVLLGLAADDKIFAV